MALIDDIEFYGRAVEADKMDRTDAARLLAEASRGGLTEYGAGDLLDRWATVRARLKKSQDDAISALRSMGVDKP